METDGIIFLLYDFFFFFFYTLMCFFLCTMQVMYLARIEDQPVGTEVMAYQWDWIESKFSSLKGTSPCRLG